MRLQVLLLFVSMLLGVAYGSKLNRFFVKKTRKLTETCSGPSSICHVGGSAPITYSYLCPNGVSAGDDAATEGETKCASCTGEFYLAEDETCTPLTVCEDDEYESSAPIEGNDRVCTLFTECEDLSLIHI